MALESENTSVPSEVESAVLAYLHGHPEAADTLEGVLGWWLPQQRYETERTRIRAALEHLVVTGALTSSALPDGETLYALADDVAHASAVH